MSPQGADLGRACVPRSSPAPRQHTRASRTVAGFVAPSSSRLTHSKSPLIPSGIPSREKREGDVRPRGVRPGARGGQGHRGADGKQGRATLPARRELTPVMSRVPFPSGGERLRAERGEGGGGEGEEDSPGAAARLVSPIFRWKKEEAREGKGRQGRAGQPGSPRGSLEAPERPEEESGSLSPRRGQGQRLRTAQPAEGSRPSPGTAEPLTRCSATSESSRVSPLNGNPGTVSGAAALHHPRGWRRGGGPTSPNTPITPGPLPAG